MPQHMDKRRARRKKLFMRTPSTFINKSKPNSSILGLGSKLHSKSTYFYRWCVPSLCASALLLGGFVAINPLLNNQVYAEPDLKSTETSISMSFPATGLPSGYNNASEQSVNVTPGEIAYRSNYFDVTLNNTSWYAVLVRAAKGYTSELRNGDTAITGVGKNVLPANFKENTWGYALTKIPSLNTAIDDSTLQYNTLPDESDILQASAIGTTDTTDHYKISFATLLSGDIPNGHYTTKVYLSAITNPGHIVSAFGQVTAMQDMTSSTCANADEHGSAQLVDTRDNKIYWVTKLKDGNCWMTQNLDYDGGGTPTPPNEWTNTDTTFLGYYDPGDYIYNPGEDGRNGSCTSTTLADCSKQFSIALGQNSLHYHVGNYYSWNAATNGTGSNMTSNGNASGSICPSGWKLPNSSNSASFDNLLKQYNLSTNISTSQLYNDPLYFTYTGQIVNGALMLAGASANYWTSTARYVSGGSEKYYSDALHSPNGSQTYIFSYYSRYTGFSVRCVFVP